MLTRDQALAILEHLSDADLAMDRARRVIASLPKADREKFDDLAGEVLDVLHGELLAAIFEQRPELELPEQDAEIPQINSTLRWSEVRLPPHVSEVDIDAIIFAVMRPHWRKVAMIVGQALEQCNQLGISISDEALAARLQALAEAGRIEDVGDLRKWRFSEVRLKD